MKTSGFSDEHINEACNHCCYGNMKLTIDTFMNWIMQMKWGDRFRQQADINHMLSEEM